MRNRSRGRGWLIAAASGAFLVASVQVVSFPAVAETDLVLNAGVQEEMRTRNVLAGDDLWTRHVLNRVYDRPLQEFPNGSLLRYVAKGVDVDEDGVFEASEFGVFGEARPAATPLEVTVYYDFNGVYWHDGVQMDGWDLLFSFHVWALNPRHNASLRVLFAGSNATYEDERQLNVTLVPMEWEGEEGMLGSHDLRIALQFRLSSPYVGFYAHTLAPVLIPLHIWSGTGGRRHADFGCAIFLPESVATSRGAPCGTPDTDRWGRGVPAAEVDLTPYRFAEARDWLPSDADVIGSGPFRFVRWWQGVSATLARNERYYVGPPFDPDLGWRLSMPRIDGIVFRLIRNVQASLYALQLGEIDVILTPVPRTFLSALAADENIGLVVIQQLGYTYLGYNLRRAPFGYGTGNLSPDAGYLLRTAVAHAIDKQQAVTTILQNYGTVADGFISPISGLWYNSDIPPSEFDLERAAGILDSPEARAANIGEDPDGPCQADGTGCRILPGVGAAPVEILSPQTEYDPLIPESWTLGDWISWSLRSLGINAKAKPMSFGAFADALEARGFDLFIWEAEVLDADPSRSLFTSFHSSGALQGMNYVGFQNSEFDGVIAAALGELDSEERRRQVWRAQDILLDQRPAEPIYFTADIEAYRRDRYTNWTPMGGTIWNYWSLLGVRPVASPNNPLLPVAMYPSAMASGETIEFLVTVFDRQHQAVPGATVTLAVDRGIVAFGETSGGAVTGTTAEDGSLRATFTAPDVTDTTAVNVTIMASHELYWPNTSQATIYVVPRGLRFLSLRTELPFGGAVTAGSVLPVRISVIDQDGVEVLDALVRVTSSDPSKLVSRPAEGLSSEMKEVILEGSPSIDRVGGIDVAVQAEKEAHVATLQTFTVAVLPRVVVQAPSSTSGYVLVAAVLVPVALAGWGVLLLSRLRRREVR